ncbi:flavodoxin [Vibrio sp. CAU 1672]|uniref:flavodoxin n=1 Tax=Vibrio sp. CAU 1672 TaxID=3032594 RepID=UPI0023DBCCAD|nr:flavodoxin [Vibrio sp. CAU 1672]MDF2154825.1 flavodoxin [Vibrio sp. CAU 1672]
MNDQQLAAIKRKNQWLHDLVEVEFPTAESLKGRALYFEALENSVLSELGYESLLNAARPDAPESIYQVDFHRLTIMFAILQSQRWSAQEEQDLIVEYLTQIILDPDFELYVAFENGEAAAAAIVSQYEGQTLISDVALAVGVDQVQFVADLALKLNQHQKLSDAILLESQA